MANLEPDLEKEQRIRDQEVEKSKISQEQVAPFNRAAEAHMHAKATGEQRELMEHENLKSELDHYLGKYDDNTPEGKLANAASRGFYGPTRWDQEPDANYREPLAKLRLLEKEGLEKAILARLEEKGVDIDSPEVRRIVAQEVEEPPSAKRTPEKSQHGLPTKTIGAFAWTTQWR